MRHRNARRLPPRLRRPVRHGAAPARAEVDHHGGAGGRRRRISGRGRRDSPHRRRNRVPAPADHLPRDRARTLARMAQPRRRQQQTPRIRRQTRNRRTDGHALRARTRHTSIHAMDAAGRLERPAVRSPVEIPETSRARRPPRGGTGNRQDVLPPGGSHDHARVPESQQARRRTNDGATRPRGGGCAARSSATRNTCSPSLPKKPDRTRNRARGRPRHRRLHRRAGDRLRPTS